MSREQLTGFFCLRRTLNGPILLLALALNAVLGQQALRAKLQLDAVLAEAAEMMGTVRFGTGGLSGQVMDASDKRAGTPSA